MKYLIDIVIILILLTLSSCGGGNTSNDQTSSNLDNQSSNQTDPNIKFPDRLKELFPNKAPQDFVLLLQIGNRDVWEDPIPLDSVYSLPETILEDTDFKYVYAIVSPGFINIGSNDDCPFSFSRIPEGYIPLSLSSREVDVAKNSDIFFSFNSSDCYPDSDNDSFSNLEELYYQDKGYHFNDASRPRVINNVSNVSSIELKPNIPTISYTTGDGLLDLLGLGLSFTIEESSNVLVSDLTNLSTIMVINGKGSVTTGNPSSTTAVNFIGSLVGDSAGHFDWNDGSYIFIPKTYDIENVNYHKTSGVPFISFSLCTSNSNNVKQCIIKFAKYDINSETLSTCSDSLSSSICTKGYWQLVDEANLPTDCTQNNANVLCYTNDERIIVKSDTSSLKSLFIKLDSKNRLVSINEIFGSENSFSFPRVCININCVLPIYNFIIYHNNLLGFLTNNYIHICSQDECKSISITGVNRTVMGLTQLTSEQSKLKYRLTYRTTVDPLQALAGNAQIDYYISDLDLPAFNDIPNSSSIILNEELVMRGGDFLGRYFKIYSYSNIYSSKNRTLNDGALTIYRNPNTFMELDNIEKNDSTETLQRKFLSRIYPDHSTSIKRSFTLNNVGGIVGVQFDNSTNVLSLLKTTISQLVDPATNNQLLLQDEQVIDTQNSSVTRVSTHLNNNNEIFVVLYLENKGMRLLTFR